MELYKCSLCNYSSLSKYNYNRHINLKHSEKPDQFKCDWCDGNYTSAYFLKTHKLLYCKKKPVPQFVTQMPQNVTQMPQFVTSVPQNVTQMPQFVTSPAQNVTSTALTIYDNKHTCPKCNKHFLRKDNLDRHIKICKAVDNSLECPKCHVKFNCRMTKSRHMKLCSALILRPATHDIGALQSEPLVQASSGNSTAPQAIVNNTSNNSGVVNNNNNIVNNQNINYITFKLDKRSRIDFNTDHITPAMIENVINASAATFDEYEMNTDIVAGLSDHLLKAIINRCVRKKNGRASYSEIHVGENKWEYRHDCEIYDKFLTDMTEVFIELLNKNIKLINVSKQFIRQLDDFLNLMADRGYCADDDPNRCINILQSYKELVKRLKIKIMNY